MRNVEKMTFYDIEETIMSLAMKARNNKLAIEDLSGGTFSISNGGIFGSMLSSPILAGDHSAIMGMHNIVNRPVVRNGQIVSRPIMYTSMSYDHRLFDGKEGAGFLKRVSDLVSDPRLLLLEL